MREFIEFEFSKETPTEKQKECNRIATELFSGVKWQCQWCGKYVSVSHWHIGSCDKCFPRKKIYNFFSNVDRAEI